MSNGSGKQRAIAIVCLGLYQTLIPIPANGELRSESQSPSRPPISRQDNLASDGFESRGLSNHSARLGDGAQALIDGRRFANGTAIYSRVKDSDEGSALRFAVEGKTTREDKPVADARDRPGQLVETVRDAIQRAQADPGTWQPVKNSSLAPALLTENEVPSKIWWFKGSKAVVQSWNGLAFDKDRGCAYASGGGHKAYGGNEVYAYCWKFGHRLTMVDGRQAPVGSWFQLTKQGNARPPKDLNGDGDIEDVGETCRGYEYGPNSTHGYDAWDVTPDGNIWRWGSAGRCQKGYGGGPLKFWKLNPETKEWTHHPVDIKDSGYDFAVQSPYYDLLIALQDGFYGFTPPDTYEKLFSYNGKWDYGVAAFGGGWYLGLHKGTGLVAVRFTESGQVAEKHIPLWGSKKLKREISKWPWNGSVAYHDERGVFTIWQASKAIWTIEPGTWRTEKYSYASDADPSGRQLYNSHVYLENHNVLLAYSDDPDKPWYIYALPQEGTSQQEKAKLQEQGYTCADGIPDWICPDLQKAVADGGEVTLPRGVYEQCAVIGKPTTLDMQRSKVRNSVCEKKGIFVQNADFTLKNATLEGARGKQGNEAGIRRQSGETHLINVSLINSHNGVLGGTGKAFTMTNGLVDQNGCCSQVPGLPAGRAHGLYISNGKVKIDGVTLSRAVGAGHLLKSGAEQLTITRSTFDETGGNGSRAIDAYNGGILHIEDTQVLAERDDGNSTVIGYDYEARLDHARNRIMIRGGSVNCAGGPLIAGRNSFEAAEPRVKTRLVDCR